MVGNFWSVVESLFRDVRHAFRGIGRSPGFAAVTIVTLALGIGANTAVFSLTYALLLRWLPVSHPEQLRFLAQQTPEGENKGLSYPAYLFLRNRCSAFAAIGSVNVPGPMLASVVGGPLEEVRREYVGAGYFAALGLRPAAGRFFTYDEDRAPSTMAVISYRYWRRHFDLNPNAVGATLYAKWGSPFTIIGVAPPGYTGITPEHSIDVWFAESDGRTNAKDHPCDGWYKPLARLKSDVTEKQALEELNVLYRAYLGEQAAAVPLAERTRLLARKLVLVPGGVGVSRLGKQLLKPLVVLSALVGLVLLLVCANIGNMLLARTAARSREIAIRLAIGAGRRHLIRQLLIESLVLAACGCVAGLWFAGWGAQALVSIHGMNLNVSPDLRVLAFTAAISIGAGVLFGLVPAWRALRSDVAPVLKGTGTRLGASRWTFGKVLVVSQVALSIVLVGGAGLFCRTLTTLKTFETGFESENLVQAEVVTTMGYSLKADPAIWRLLDKVRGLPGVISTATGFVPSDTPGHQIEVEGYPAPVDEQPEAQLRDVVDGYFETLRVPLLQGRFIEPRDCGTNKTKVALVNASFARRFFGNDSPLGRRVTAQFAGPKMGPFEIVGVVADARLNGPKTKPLPELYIPVTRFFGTFLLIRTAGPSRELIRTLPNFVQREEPDLRVIRIESVKDATSRTLIQERLLAGLSGFFGVLALSLASLGIFGVTSYTVGQRTAELGIRMALGAQRLSVLWLVQRQTLIQLGTGIALGIPIILAGGKLVASLLYGVEPSDPTTLGLAVLMLVICGLVAGYIPARRAARLDPVAALRSE